MPWRLPGLVNRYGAERRPHASLQAVRLGATSDAGLISPRLSRSKGSEVNGPAHISAAKAPRCQPPSLKRVVGRDDARLASRGQDEVAKAQFPLQTPPNAQAAFKPASKCREFKLHYHMSQATKKGWRSKFRKYVSSVPINEDEAIHKDLDSITDIYRATRSKDDLAAGMPARELGTAFSHHPDEWARLKIGKIQHVRQQKRPILHHTLLKETQSFGKIHYASISTGPVRSQAHAISATEDCDRMPLPEFMQENTALHEGLGGKNIREHLRIWQAHQNGLSEHAGASREILRDSTTDTMNERTQADESSLFPSLASTEIDHDEEDHAETDQDDGALGIEDRPYDLFPGDLAVLRLPQGLTLSVFAKHIGLMSLFYSQRGSWIISRVGQCVFLFPKFVDANELADLLTFIPDLSSLRSGTTGQAPLIQDAPREAGRHVLESMQSFENLSDDLYRKHADRLNHAYDLFAPQTYVEGFRKLSLRDITKQLFRVQEVSELTPVLLWTCQRTLERLQNVTKEVRNGWDNPNYLFIPKQNLEHLKLTQKWMRDFQEHYVDAATTSKDKGALQDYVSDQENPIASFAAKARNFILQSRQKRSISPTGGLGPSVDDSDALKPDGPHCSVTPVASLSKNDTIILHYLNAWVTVKSLSRYEAYRALGPMILRAVGLYEHLDLNTHAGYTFLQELGIIAPWQNTTHYELRTGLPGYDPHSPLSLLRMKASHQLSSLEMKDKMERYRKDWGDMPVFCIDGPEALERDDGISVENIDGKPSESWIHVHVANPSAFLSPDSSIAQYAAELSESFYLPQEKHPMLHPDLSSKYFSLAKDRPCITFSGRINDNGDILESSVTNGIVRNVHCMTPMKVRAELEPGNGVKQNTVAPWGVGRIPPTALSSRDSNDLQSRQPFSEETLAKLRRIVQIGQAVKLRRERNGAFPFQALNSNDMPIVLFGSQEANLPRAPSKKIQRFDGDPTILIKHGLQVDKMDFLVSEIMILAGEICAQWCSKRRIPIPYRGMHINPDPEIPPDEYYKDVVLPNISQGNDVVLGNSLRYYTRLLGITDVSASPLKHPQLGLSCYAKATSPLRRYNDLVVHWQIEAALRREKETDTGILEDDVSSYLPFSNEQVEAVSKQLKQRATVIRRTVLSNFVHWHTLALFRAFYFGEAPLPETFEVIVAAPTWGGFATTATIVGWGTRVILQDEPPIVHAHGGYQQNDVWEVEIELIKVYTKCVEMKPIRLVSRPKA